jgi:hypothetical protein
MLKKILVSSLLLLLPILSFANGEGYGKTVWGMSPQEVLQAESDRAQLIKPAKYAGSWGKVQIKNVSIGSATYTVDFLFDESDKLIQTNVKSNDNGNAGIARNRFTTLNQLLTQKYGEPQFKGSNSVTWKTSDTTIELKLLIIGSVTAQTIIRYIPNTQVQADTANL